MMLGRLGPGPPTAGPDPGPLWLGLFSGARPLNLSGFDPVSLFAVVTRKKSLPTRDTGGGAA